MRVKRRNDFGQSRHQFEDLVTRAVLEFEEEIGFRPIGTWIELGSVTQAGGKRVHAWAVEGDLPPGFVPVSNSFEIEWPPRSGKRATFPEVDEARFFSLSDAHAGINAAQRAFLDRLAEALAARTVGSD